MGIECDGATYHSAKSTRDRDRLRQEILEGLGWKIHRIWSTDWFRNPQIPESILQELERRKTPIEKLSDSISTIEENAQNTNVFTSFDDKLSLKESLLSFNENVIIKENPNTPDDKRLLRPAMMEALFLHLPCSKAEFQEYIPFYLRTESQEGEYLERVLNIIANYDTEIYHPEISNSKPTKLTDDIMLLPFFRHHKTT